MYALGKTIRILRQAKDVKLTTLAAAAKVSIPFLSLVESGERQPSLEILRRIAKGLNIPSEVLILMSVGPSSDLSSSNETANNISGSVAKLIELEEKLQRVLLTTENKDASIKDTTG